MHERSRVLELIQTYTHDHMYHASIFIIWNREAHNIINLACMYVGSIILKVNILVHVSSL
jgi:hypothetical protein